MIKETDQLIMKYVESGDYYADARKWYEQKYLSVNTQSYQVKLLVVLMFFAIIGMWVLYNENVKSKKYPFPIYSYEQTEFFPHIKPLAKEKEPISISVSRYLLKKYVDFRESYKYQNYSNEGRDVQIKRVQAMSSRKVFREYIDYIDPDINPHSPLVLYKIHMEKEVHITNVKYLSNNTVEIYYETFIKDVREISKNLEEHEKTKWKATISFRMSDIGKVLDKKQPMSFVVTNYETIKL